MTDMSVAKAVRQQQRAGGPAPSLCFVAPGAYSVLAGSRDVKVVGGAEIQQCILAREFVRRGHAVSMICMNYGQQDGVVIDGIKVYRMHGPDEGLPVLRFIHPRFTSLWAALRRANADIYYQRAGGALTGMVVAFTRLARRMAVFAGASDMDFDPRLPFIRHARDRGLFRWGLRRVQAVVVQSERQGALCRQHFRPDTTLIRSCYDHIGQAAAYDGPVLWVSSVKDLKRPEMFVELARSLPQFQFRLVGGGSEAHMASLRELAKGLGNIEFTGFVPFVDVEAMFDGASMLVNTSVAEGFPNTFLQAWSRGMPSVSFFDPGAVHDGAAVGSVAGSLGEMVAQVLRLKSQPVLWQREGQRCRDYFEASFSTRAAADQYQALFTRLVEARA